MLKSWARVCAILIATSLLAACGSEENKRTIDLPDGPVEPAEEGAIELASTYGCAVDSDCKEGRFCFQGTCAYECSDEVACSDGSTCSPRGQCVEASAQDDGQALRAQPLVSEFFEDVELADVPQTQFTVTSAGDEVSLELKFDTALPDKGLPYRISRSDGVGDAERVERTEGGVDSVSIPLELGLADPTLDESTTVYVEVFTPVGSFEVSLEPAFSANGAYAGTAVLETFGRVGLPLEFEVVTQPMDATLDEADSAWLVLPVSREKLFSPVYPDGTVDHVAAELVYDDFVGTWVATFDNAFDLNTAGIWQVPRAEQVGRSMRFEVAMEGKNKIFGSFTDRWTGLYEVDSAQGVTTLETVVTTGDIFMERVGESRPSTGLNVGQQAAPDSQLLPAPAIDACADDIFTVAARDIDGESYGCDGIASAADFEAADADAKALCAVAVGDEALAGQTTGGRINAFLNDSGNTGGQSFDDFLAECAAGTDGTCRPSAEVTCGRQLLARAYHDQPEGSTRMSALVENYLDIARESYLGRQLGAFATDFNMRMAWLEATNYPAVVTSAVQEKNEELLDEWKQKVLDVHVGVLTGQFDPSGLAVMARETSSTTAGDARQRLLMEMTQSWRGAMESLTLATARWNTLLQAEADRDEKAGYVTEQMFKLYVTAGSLRSLARSAGAGYLVASFGSGFSTLMTELQSLERGFDERVYARDGEVVVNTSINPESSNDNLLTEREETARAEIAEAHAAITDVLAEARAEALDQEELRNRINNQIGDLRAELVEYCGLPAGCSVDDWATGVAGCEVDTAAGRCGFEIDKETGEIAAFDTGDQNVSEAGGALLELAESAQNVKIARQDLQALIQRLSLDYSELEAFAADIETWNQTRLDGLRELEANIAQRQQIRNDAVEEILANIAERASIREASIVDMGATFSQWQSMRAGNIETTLGLMTQAAQERKAARELGLGADIVMGAFEVLAEAVPDEMGDDDVVFATAAAGFLAAGVAGSTLLNILALNREANAERLDLAAEANSMMREAQMESLAEQYELANAVEDHELATLRDEVVARDQLTDKQVEQLEQTIELARAYRQAELTYKRDLADFRAKRTELRQELTKMTGLELRVQQAVTQFQQGVSEYRQWVQKAQLTQAKLDDLLRQRDNINQIIGSPAAIFARANDLERGERKLEQAKDALMEWLVTLEYYAVRPFMDQRLQILLARNTYQLEKIADELLRLQRDCGGPINELTTTLSVREDLLGIRRPVKDRVTGERLGPEERFRRVLQRGYVPVGKRVRYSTDETIGGLMATDPDILAATFFVEVNDFANLELTCNAKIKSIKVKLDGDIGEGRPTVTLLYDGTATLLSCQPNIEEYVSQFGPGATSFGKITQLRTSGRSMSPAAGINEFIGADGQASETFGGLPLVNQYTVLINKSAGENPNIDWDELEDIELELTYSYQDVFPEGQCE
jgi:hypothetical protein